MKVLRGAAGLVAGYAVMSVGVVIATWLMSLAVPAYGAAGSGAPPAPWAMLNLAYSAGFLILGAYVAQWVAGGSRPLVPLVMGALMVVMALAQFGRGMEGWPGWYRAGLLVLPLPAAWLGGVLRLRRSARGESSPRTTRQRAAGKS